MAGDKKGKDYQQGRDFASLKSFAERTLNKPMCDAATKKGCAKNELAFIEKHEGKSKDEIKAVAAEKATSSRRSRRSAPRRRRSSRPR